MEKKIFKPGMMSGIAFRENVELEMEDNIFEVEIRPLRHSEASQIQALLSVGIKVQGFTPKEDMSNVEVDNEKMIEAQAKAHLKAAALGTMDKCWNEITIDVEWPIEFIQKVGARVMAISGIGNVEEIKKFRAERAGTK